MHRLFVAIRPPAHIRDQLTGLMHGVGGARWQDDSQLHLTLRFIGNVEAHLAEDIALALESVSAAPLDVVVKGLGQFDHKGHTDTLWVGATPRDALTALHRKIDQLVARCGLPPEQRAFVPHITIARFGRVCDGLETFFAQHADLALSPFRAQSFGLYESVQLKSAQHYELIRDYGLNKGALATSSLPA